MAFSAGQKSVDSSRLDLRAEIMASSPCSGKIGRDPRALGERESFLRRANDAKTIPVQMSKVVANP
jgi:hypothetical protein